MEIKLDKDTTKRLKKLARDRRRTIKKQVEFILVDYVETEDVQLEKKRAGFLI